MAPKTLTIAPLKHAAMKASNEVSSASQTAGAKGYTLSLYTLAPGTFGGSHHQDAPFQTLTSNIRVLFPYAFNRLF